MTWFDRLRETITMTSPSGTVFEALWRGNTRTREKKLGIFQFPRTDGVVIQDLGLGGTVYPLTVFFAGADHDLQAAEFFNALSEQGTWQVQHPVHGLLVLQPVSFSPADNPVESGNITQVETNWIEPVPLLTVQTAAEIQAEAAEELDTVNELSSDQLDANVLQETAGEVSGFRGAVNGAVGVVSGALGAISSASAAVTAEINAIQRDISNVLSVVPADVIAVAGQLQNLIQLPALLVEDVTSRLASYETMLDNAIAGFGFDSPDTAARNTVAVKEQTLVAGLGAVAAITSNVVLQSRQDAIDLIEKNVDLFTRVVNSLDADQAAFKDEPIDVQYFSQSASYASLQRLMGLAIRYQLRALFDLSVEKRIKLDRPRAPIEIVISEYGSLGENDSNLDLFITSNNLRDSEILLLPYGREVVIYV